MTILIVGGTGKTGRRVAQRLRDRGQPVRAVSRRTSPAFDWENPRTWEAAVNGCTAAYVTFQPDLGLPGADETIGAFAELAVRRGCERVVLLSGRGEPGAQAAERAFIASGARWTVVRSAFFAQNFTESFWADELAHGSLTMVEHRVGEPFVDADDIADVVVAMLLDAAHSGRTYELTGPRLVSFAEVATEVAAIIGRPVTYTELGVEEYRAALVAAGLPDPDAAGLAYLFADVLDGRNAHVTSGVRDILGREPRDIVTVLTHAGADGAWEG